MNVLNMQYITPNSKRWDYSDIPGGGHKRFKDPSTWLKVATFEKPPTPPTDGWRMARHQLRTAAMLKCDKTIWQNRSMPWLLMPWFLLVTRISATRLLNMKYEKLFALHKKLFHALYHISLNKIFRERPARSENVNIVWAWPFQITTCFIIQYCASSHQISGQYLKSLES